QERLERDAMDAASDLRRALARNLQDMLALPDGTDGVLAWEGQANELLSRRPELVRLEWRDAQMRTRAEAVAPSPDGTPPHRDAAHSETAMACANARRLMAP